MINVFDVFEQFVLLMVLMCVRIKNLDRVNA